MTINPACDECGAEITGKRVRGRCRPCYKRLYKKLKREGTFVSLVGTSRSGAPLCERLLAHIEKTDTCWWWTGHVAPKGYGVIYLRGKPLYVHRVSYEVHVGPIPDGLVIDHACHNRDAQCTGGFGCIHRRCVNPEHLEAVTDAVNRLRGRGGGANNRTKTHCIRGHAFTPENTERQGPSKPGGRERRRCRTCTQANRARRRQAKASSAQ
ncbi:HNH endonuclease signature motif containing protein [Streptomyces sp. NPDC057424]|uniref:HNH endonuclease signature motif containing protein n=1 Tax=Streptomyces sp. NPDC057424 TaxID=3346127 RepID=UPI00369AAF7E